MLKSCWKRKSASPQSLSADGSIKCSKISWWTAALSLDLIKHNGPTPADVTAPQIITDCGNFTLDFKQLWFCASLLFLQTLISKWKTKFTFTWKEDFGPLSNSPVIFLLSPGKMLLTLFLFQKWLGSPFPEDVWAWWLLMHWLQLQSTPCEALPSVWIGFACQYSQACGHPCCLCTFSYPNSSFQSTLNLICFDTALLEQPPLSVMTLCYPLSTSRNQVLVQSQCYCQFLVGSTREPFKNRLLFHRLESQYRARTYVTEYVSCFVSLARQRQTQQTCSRCIAPLRSIGTQHTKAPRERSKSIKSRQLSSRSRCTPMPRTERVRVAPIHPEQA